ncbi:MAG TPA: YggS family pyridoxal phosphate-dependent enzyme, partial [Arachnia sp.]|nr:YggS family pyridoxal phosphate-dependent enzyme [Arachnia sp.]
MQYPAAHTPEEFAARVAAVRARIDAAAARAGRDPGEVRLLPVSKTVPS